MEEAWGSINKMKKQRGKIMGVVRKVYVRNRVVDGVDDSGVGMFDQTKGCMKKPYANLLSGNTINKYDSK